MLPCVCSCATYLIWWDGWPPPDKRSKPCLPPPPTYSADQGNKHEKRKVAIQLQHKKNMKKQTNSNSKTVNISFMIYCTTYPHVPQPVRPFFSHLLSFWHHRIILLSHYMHTYLLSVRTASHNKYDGRKRWRFTIYSTDLPLTFNEFCRTVAMNLRWVQIDAKVPLVPLM